MSWNELEPPGTRWDQQQNTALPGAHLEPSGTSTMELFNYFAKRLHLRRSTGS